jgi:hypothetical protein
MRTESITGKNISPGIICAVPWRLTKIRSLKDYKLEVDFIDGTHGLVEMKQLIIGKKAGVFAKLIDVNIFNQVYLEYGVATWPGEIDLAPDAMYDEIKNNGHWILE